MAGFGIFSIDRQQFVTKFISHSSRYTGPPLRSDSRSTIEGWLDSPGRFNGQNVEIRPDPPDYER